MSTCKVCRVTLSGRSHQQFCSNRCRTRACRQRAQRVKLAAYAAIEIEIAWEVYREFNEPHLMSLRVSKGAAKVKERGTITVKQTPAQSRISMQDALNRYEGPERLGAALRVCETIRWRNSVW